ncbi:MAG: putative toxin-antitoxin system toxin component, PIN family [Isosphaeraceae bacterium]
MTRVVLDCMVFLQAAARSTGPAAACLQAARDGRVELWISPDVIAEVRDVLTRPRVLKKFPALSVEAVDLFLNDLRTFARLRSDVPRAVRPERAPKDEPYLNLSIAVGATYLASWDLDLLDLMRDELARQQFPHLQILDSPALLRLIPRG